MNTQQVLSELVVKVSDCEWMRQPATPYDLSDTDEVFPRSQVALFDRALGLSPEHERLIMACCAVSSARRSSVVEVNLVVPLMAYAIQDDRLGVLVQRVSAGVGAEELHHALQQRLLVQGIQRAWPSAPVAALSATVDRWYRSLIYRRTIEYRLGLAIGIETVESRFWSGAPRQHLPASVSNLYRKHAIEEARHRAACRAHTEAIASVFRGRALAHFTEGIRAGVCAYLEHDPIPERMGLHAIGWSQRRARDATPRRVLDASTVDKAISHLGLPSMPS